MCYLCQVFTVCFSASFIVFCATPWLSRFNRDCATMESANLLLQIVKSGVTNCPAASGSRLLREGTKFVIVADSKKGVTNASSLVKKVLVAKRRTRVRHSSYAIYPLLFRVTCYMLRAYMIYYPHFPHLKKLGYVSSHTDQYRQRKNSTITTGPLVRASVWRG